MSKLRGDRRISWVVCDRTGRWAAALRVAIARDGAYRTDESNSHRIKEIQGLAELNESLDELGALRCASRLNGRSLLMRSPVVLVEVGEESLADVLEFFSARHGDNLKFVAMMDERLEKSTARVKTLIRKPDFTSDVLFEAGVVDVLKSPRQIARLFPLAARLVQAGSCFGKTTGDDSIAEMAKLALPWQDD